MADDGMLLNFNLDDAIIKTQQKFKGGPWKARLSAKKIANRRNLRRPLDSGDGRAPGGKEAVANSDKVDLTATRSHKRQRTDGDFKPSSRRAVGLAGGPQEHRSQKSLGHGKGQPREIISSLFSYNPVATSITVEKPGVEANAEHAEPTNAPLVDGIDTFTSLGLSPVLAAHLLTKLDLKVPTAIQKSAISQLLEEDCDAFIQAETGSGKTLAYLLPLVQRLMRLSHSANRDGEKQNSAGGNEVHRDSGLFAIVLAPTRELCKQISVVLEDLLRCAHWIVAGTVIGGEKKKSEKARLRKGLNILVATPGRLADHLDNTKVLDVSMVRWLVLDEGDRLMDLGFEEEIQGIVRKLDGRQKPTQIPGLPMKRTTILCSATMKMNVQRLGEISLKDAVHIKVDPATEDEGAVTMNTTSDSQFSVPAQLKQSYVVVAAKLRLVTLTALLRRTFARKGVMKAIVFLSCADSVDFHFEVFSRKSVEDDVEEGSQTTAPSTKSPASIHPTIAKAAAFSNPSNPVTIHKLHGSLPQQVRTSTLSAFSSKSDTSVLICTDVASRGLDVPNVDFIIEYDPAFSSDDHLHRIGRTARLGRDGRALIFLLPGSEEGYVGVLKSGYRDGGGKALSRGDANEILKRGFGGNTDATSKGWEEKASEWQLDVERWAIDNPAILEMGRRAYQSHIRAYATHIARERSMFNIKELHLGHLAKSFALRDRPAKINVPGLRPGREEAKKAFKAARKVDTGEKRKAASGGENSVTTDATEAARKMRAKLREHMAGASEFNIA